MDVRKRVIFLLQMAGTDPYRQGASAHILFILSMFSAGSTVYFNAISLVHDHSFENVSGLAESLPVLYQSFTKLVRTKLKIRKIKVLLDRMDTFWGSDSVRDSEGIVEGGRDTFRKIYRGFSLLALVMVLVYCIRPLTMPERTWPMPWNYGACDINDDRCFLLIYLWQMHDALLTYLSLSAFDGLFMLITHNVYEQLTFVKLKFQRLRSTDNPDKDVEDFNEIVNHHNVLLETIRMVDDVYNVLLFEQLWSSNVSICMGIFLLILDGDFGFAKILKYATFLSAFLVEAFLFCYFGQVISNAADDVAFAVYESGWMETTRMEWKKGVVLVAQIAQNSPKLTVAKMLDLNMQTFGSVLRNSLSFCTLMQSVYNF